MIEKIQEINVDKFDANQFEHLFYSKSIPLIVRGLEIRDPENKWTIDHFREIPSFLEKEVHVRVYETTDLPNFFVNGEKFQDDGFIDSGMDMKIIDALELVTSDPKKNGKYHNILEGDIKELIDNINLPDFMLNKTNKNYGNVWIGNGNITGIHFDGYNNFFFQKKGSKRFIIFDPVNYSYLYPYGPNSGSFQYLQKVDEKRFPLYKYAKSIEIVLNENDFLYLPPFWWHQVEGLEPYVSINYWGTPSLEQCLCQPGYYFIMKHFELGNLVDLASAFFEDKSNWNFSVTQIAHRLIFLGHNWVAVLILIAMMERNITLVCKSHGFSLSDSNYKRINDLAARMDKSEINNNSILLENLGEDRLLELISIVSDNRLFNDETISNLYNWCSYIKLAKKHDNILLTTTKIHELVEGLEKVHSEIESSVA